MFQQMKAGVWGGEGGVGDGSLLCVRDSAADPDPEHL
jgi:hypothetical protein